MENSTILIMSILGVFVVAMFITAKIVKDIPEAKDVETRKIRFAAVTFTGIMMLVLVTAILAVAIPTDTSFEVFKTVITALSPVAGGIIGYLFASRNSN